MDRAFNLFSVTTSNVRPEVQKEERKGTVVELLGSSTSTNEAPSFWERLPPRLLETNAGLSTRVPLDQSSSVSELRRLSGLTWEELGKIFGVSRRSVHFWASGKPINEKNAERLQQMVLFVKYFDRGSATENRAVLTNSPPGQRSVFELLAKGHIQEAMVRVQGMARFVSRVSTKPIDLNSEMPVSELVGALHDRPVPAGRLLGSKSIKTRRDNE